MAFHAGGGRCAAGCIRRFQPASRSQVGLDRCAVGRRRARARLRNRAFRTGGANGLRAWIRAAWPPTLAGLLLFYAAGLYYLALGIPGVGYSKHSELIPVGWKEFGARIRQLADDTEKASGKAPLIVGMDRYAIASELAFYAPDRAKSVSETTSAHLFGQVGLMYERWFPVGRAGRSHAAAGRLGPRRSRLGESGGERRAAGPDRRGRHHARQPGHSALLLLPRRWLSRDSRAAVSGGNGREVLEMLARGDFLELHMDLGCVLFRYA